MQRALKKYVPIILPIYPLALSVVLIDVDNDVTRRFVIEQT